MIHQEDLLGNSKAGSISLEQLAQGQKVPSADMSELDVLSEPEPTPYDILHSQFPYEMAKAYCMVPLRLIYDGVGDYLRTIIVVMADANNPKAQEYLRVVDDGISASGAVSDDPVIISQALYRYKINYRILIQTAPEEKVKEAIDRFYSAEASHERVSKVILPVLKEMDRAPLHVDLGETLKILGLDEKTEK